jgi:hypothetical protein
LSLVVGFWGVLLLTGCGALAAEAVRPPEAFLGHRVGEDYQLARYEKISAYFRHVADASSRVRVRDIGPTTEGRRMILAEITEEAQPGPLSQAMARQKMVADPRLIPDEKQEQQLVQDSKVVVLVSCNLHSTEIASSQMAMELLYDLATDTTAEVRDILRRVIVVLIPSANPDGLDKVIEWYERSLGKPWEGAGMPWLYHPYAGHDNNRDWFMLNLQETRLITHVIYKEWLPEVVYDIHQMGSSGARLFVPPFFDPKNPNIHPLNDSMMLIIGGHMAAALTRAGKQGVIHSAMYDNWWQGGFRTVVYRHNMTGILTEAASVLIASPVFLRKNELSGGPRGMPDYEVMSNFPDPWPGGWWRLRDIAEYEKIACLSLFTLAARYHDLFKSNVIKQARDALERGAGEPPCAWLVPADQRDPRTAAEMLKVLHATGIEVHQAQAPFTADGVEYPAQTFVLYCRQPYRSHLNDMMERQEYPNRSLYPQGPPEAPYDIAGWTLPLQMGVRAVSVNRPFECQARKLDEISLPAGKITDAENAGGFLVPAGANDNYRLLNRLFAAGVPVRRVVTPASWKTLLNADVPTGSLFLPDVNALGPVESGILRGISCTLTGIRPKQVTKGLASQGLTRPRLGLYQPWVANADEGWTRLVLENFEFKYDSVHNAEIRAGDLRKRYDCLVLPSASAKSIVDGMAVDATEPQYVGGIGSEGIVALQNFVQEGGTLVCLDASCNFPIDYFRIPVRNALRDKAAKEFFCPGSVLRIWVDRQHPVGYGLPEWVSGYFTRSQAFEVTEKPKKPEDSDARNPSVRYPTRVIARYSDTVLLESGWIRAPECIADKPAIVEVRYGDGKIILLGFRVQHRAQPHGTFPLLFNAILSGTIDSR